MKFSSLLVAKYLIVYLYGVFILNIVSIFYMDRANNILDSRVEFLATLIIPIFFGYVSVARISTFTAKQTILAGVILLVFGPIVFFTHVVLSL